MAQAPDVLVATVNVWCCTGAVLTRSSTGKNVPVDVAAPNTVIKALVVAEMMFTANCV
tara:strand:+ start:611 stop:784 length:174 start_codon:yes stop_codon:yes gene_type:complete